MRIFILPSSLLGSLFLSMLLAGCVGPSSNSKTAAKAEQHLDEPGRMIHTGDLMKITIRLPDHTLGSLEPVADDGDVPTPEGSFVKAAGMTLGSFRKNLTSFYATIPGYEKVQFEAYIFSSPYAIILPSAPMASSPGFQGMDYPANAPVAAPKEKPPIIYRRIFEAPLTVWQAIKLEGGIPPKVDPRHIRILKGNLERKTLDCSGPNGAPDGNTAVETNDSIFVVSDDVPVSKIFEN